MKMGSKTMNNLKFRAYIKSTNKFADVLGIDFKNNTLLLDIDSDKMIPKPYYWWYETTLSFEDVVLMQSTGLKDKNGIEIFIGDIVKFLDEYEFVSGAGETTDVTVCDGFNIASVVKKGSYITLDNFVYEDGITEIELDNHEWVFDDLDFENLEVIGNIYENKELLENDR